MSSTTTSFDQFLTEQRERLLLIDEKLKKMKKMRNIWRGYRKRHKKMATQEKDIFSQTRNSRAALKSINPYNAKRLQD